MRSLRFPKRRVQNPPAKRLGWRIHSRLNFSSHRSNRCSTSILNWRTRDPETKENVSKQSKYIQTSIKMFCCNLYFWMFVVIEELAAADLFLVRIYERRKSDAPKIGRIKMDICRWTLKCLDSFLWIDSQRTNYRIDFVLTTMVTILVSKGK